jgi:predicted phosphodiesterase
MTAEQLKTMVTPVAEPARFENLGVLSDIHGNALALEAVLEDARRLGIRSFVNLGDIVYGPLEPRRTLEILDGAAVIATICGNQDRQIFQATAEELAASRTLAFVRQNLGQKAIAWLRSLPRTAVVDRSVFLCHGVPSSDTTYLLEDVSSGHAVVHSEAAIMRHTADILEPVILCGHSHIPRTVQLAGGQLIVNPGSVGVPAYDDRMPVPHAMENFSPHASYAVLRGGEWGWNVSLHRVAYDWKRAAEQARVQGREDWAQAIETGRVRAR